MATYLVDFELSLYHTEQVEATSAAEARALCEERLESDGFWQHLLDCYDDPLRTDWLPENVTVTVYGEAGAHPQASPTEYAH
ncbi:MAG: hypothetical protein IJI12_05225 [Atopobiaceae bacterium]|nr:hypothetical protein [Atopobiaceae bacterium]